MLAAGALSCAGAAAPVKRVPASLTLVSLTPAPNSFVDAGTLVRAKLYCVLPEGYPGDYFVEPWFAVREGGRSVVRSLGGIAVTPVRETRTYVSVEFPMLRVLQTARLAQPVQLWFTLQMSDGKAVHPAANAGPYLFRAGAR